MSSASDDPAACLGGRGSTPNLQQISITRMTNPIASLIAAPSTVSYCGSTVPTSLVVRHTPISKRQMDGATAKEIDEGSDVMCYRIGSGSKDPRIQRLGARRHLRAPGRGLFRFTPLLVQPYKTLEVEADHLCFCRGRRMGVEIFIRFQ